MKLSIEQLRSMTQGAVRVFEIDGSVCFRRFTDEQEELYRISNEEFWKKTFSTAGIKLCFETNSEIMNLSVLALESTSRTYFSIDVFSDDQFVGAIENHTEDGLAGDYTEVRFPLGHFEKEFVLGSGMKTVTIYLPWSVELRIESLCLDDQAEIIPVKSEKTLLVFGDSITHGYDAVHPVNRYAAQAARALQAEEYNKAIGGEVFFPELAEAKENFDPDYVLVAYGTNDWGLTTWDKFSKNCREFYKILAEQYPKANIYALAPIWRKDFEEVRECCDFRQVAAYIHEVTKPYSNIKVIDCFDFVPKEERYFADFKLHPNDKGFEHYGKNLIVHI